MKIAIAATSQETDAQITWPGCAGSLLPIV